MKKSFKVPELIPFHVRPRASGIVIGEEIAWRIEIPDEPAEGKTRLAGEVLERIEEENKKIMEEIISKLKAGKVRFYTINQKTGEEVEYVPEEA